MTEHPWNEERLSARERTLCTLTQLWSHHLRSSQLKGEHFGLMLALVEDANVGNGRHIAMQEVKSRLHFGKYNQYKSLPPMKQVLARLRRPARKELDEDRGKESKLGE